jgi:hypothetical protein
MDKAADAVVGGLSDQGLAGVVIIMLALFIGFLIKEHKAERAESEQRFRAERGEWLVAYKENSLRMNDILTKLFIEHDKIMRCIKSFNIEN